MSKVGIKDTKDGGKRTSMRVNKLLEPLLEKYIARYGGQTRAITECMGRYDAMMRIERRMLVEMFSEAEKALMLNVGISTMYNAPSIPGAVLGGIEDESANVIETFGVDKKVLVGKLRELSTGAQFALVDWLEDLRGNDPQVPED